MDVIPSEWDIRPLGEITDFLDGRRRPVKDSDRAKMRGDVPYYGASGVVDYVNDYLFDEDLILLGEDGENILSRNSRLAFKISGKAWVNNHAHVLRTKAGISLDYLAEFLESCDYSSYNTGTAQPKLNKLVCSRIPVLCPPFHEQCAIAATLSDVDELRAGLDRLIAKKRDLRQAAMQQLLTSHTRLPGFHEEWRTFRLGDIARVKTGSRNNEDKVEGGRYPFFVRSEVVEKIDAYSYDCEAILVPGEGRIGEIFHYVNGRFDVHQRVYAITQFKPEISGKFVYLFMSMKFGEWAMQNTVKATVDSLRLPTFLTFELKAPPEIAEQLAIVAAVFDMDAAITTLETQRDKTRALKQAMMQELLTGKIRLVDPPSKVDAPDFTTVSAPIPTQQPTTKPHNWQINEAVVVAVLVKQFGSEQYPLGRKRCTKLAYLMHRHVEHVAQGYLKKAAGPYNPAVKYKGPEGIAQKNGYIRGHSNREYSGFVAAEKIAQAEGYFDKWYGRDVLAWLEQFRRLPNDELELLATVDMAVEDLRCAGTEVSVDAVKSAIRQHPEWEAKLEREIFSDVNLDRAMRRVTALFPAVAPS